MRHKSHYHSMSILVDFDVSQFSLPQLIQVVPVRSTVLGFASIVTNFSRSYIISAKELVVERKTQSTHKHFLLTVKEK